VKDLPPPPAAAVTGSDRLSAELAPSNGWGTLAAHRSRFAAPPPTGRSKDEKLIDVVEAAGLHGRGGAGFPTAVKMHAVASGRRTPIILANGSEGEPTSSKDALLMSRAPHLVLDGAFLAAAAVGADQVIVGVKIGAGHAREAIAHALQERYETEPWTPRVRVIDVPPRYLAGEERALINLIDHGKAIPPSGTARPFEHGVGGRPTLVQNVETLARVPQALADPTAFRTSESTLVTFWGDVRSPGVREVPLGTPLADVDGVYNAVVAEGDLVGKSVYEGRGAGAGPTASAVVSDILDIARGQRLPAFGAPAANLKRPQLVPMGDHVGACYLRFTVIDRPGVIAVISRCLADQAVSIESMLQRIRSPGEPVPVVFITHEAREAEMTKALQAIVAAGVVTEAPCMIRMERF
jgi:hypothetical protein